MRWGSLSIRLSAVFVVLLVTAALAVGYLFDRGRVDALEQRELQHLRLHAERAADALEREVRQLRSDVLFLAGTPPIQGIRRALEGNGLDAAGNSTLEQWKQRLQHIFVSFAQASPEYFQLRLIGTQDGGREIVRVEQTLEGLAVTPRAALQRKGGRYYFREASATEPGAVYLSRIDLNREHGQVSVPHQPTLRAATPVHDSTGNLFGVVVLNMDMGQAFKRAASFRDSDESVYIVDERGDFLLHPEPGRAFAFEFGEPFRLADAFPWYAERFADTLSVGERFLEVPGPNGGVVAYLTSRALDPENPSQRLFIVLTEPIEQLFQTVRLLRRESFFAMGGLLSLAIVLVIVMVRRMTRSLGALANESKAIARGDYEVSLPMADGSEVGSVVLAFQRMAAEVERREEALEKLNRDLSGLVDERTRELARQHNLQQLILENIADGVVVSDREGHFLHWNRKAEQMLGSGPEEIPPERWSSYFGLFRDESGIPVPFEELPLVRAMRGESTSNAELYLSNPRLKEGRWAQVTARPLRGTNGSISGAVAVIVDVTEHKRMQARIKRHRNELTRVGRRAFSAEIASSVAHQLSQPIAAMCNYAGAAVRLNKQGRLEEGELSEILSRIERLSIQSGEILGKLRARIRRREQATIAFDVNDVAASCLDLLKDKLERLGVKVSCCYGDDLPRLVGDPIELEQVLIQLASNALEAMEKTARDDRCLTIRTGWDPAANIVMIDIGDTGPGVSAALVESLFELWETDKPKALGIGLSIAQSIVESFGGQIRLERASEGGALFRIELSVKRKIKE